MVKVEDTKKKLQERIQMNAYTEQIVYVPLKYIGNGVEIVLTRYNKVKSKKVKKQVQ